MRTTTATTRRLAVGTDFEAEADGAAGVDAGGGAGAPVAGADHAAAAGAEAAAGGE
jgi:hypothetical protein